MKNRHRKSYTSEYTEDAIVPSSFTPSLWFFSLHFCISSCLYRPLISLHLSIYTVFYSAHCFYSYSFFLSPLPLWFYFHPSSSKTSSSQTPTCLCIVYGLEDVTDRHRNTYEWINWRSHCVFLALIHFRFPSPFFIKLCITSYLYLLINQSSFVYLHHLLSLFFLPSSSLRFHFHLSSSKTPS